LGLNAALPRGLIFKKLGGLVDAGVKTPVYLRFVFLGSVVSQVSKSRHGATGFCGWVGLSAACAAWIDFQKNGWIG
jgi:hypothetical protein